MYIWIIEQLLRNNLIFLIKSYVNKKVDLFLSLYGTMEMILV